MSTKREREYAVQQFTGYAGAHNGHGIIGLAEAMGLTAKEWSQIRGDVQWLGHRNLEELDEHFSTTPTEGQDAEQ